MQVLDECHHCLKKSPYSQIMQLYGKLPPQEQAHTKVRVVAPECMYRLCTAKAEMQF